MSGGGGGTFGGEVGLFGHRLHNARGLRPQGHFGVWLDASLDHGMSRPNATYAAPCLASDQTFGVAAVECWLLRRPEDDASRHSKGSRSALDANKEDQVIMGLVGVGNKGHSAGIRDEPLED